MKLDDRSSLLHTKGIIKIVPVVPLFGTQHSQELR